MSKYEDFRMVSVDFSNADISTELHRLKGRIVKSVLDSINEDTENNAFFNRLLEVVKGYEGKTYSKRLVTAIDKALKAAFPDGSACAYEYKIASMFYVRVMLPKHPDKKHLDFLAAYDTTPVITVENFKRFNIWAGEAAVERVKENKAWLECEGNVDYLADSVLTIAINNAAIEKTIGDLPAKYAIERGLFAEMSDQKTA